MNQTKWKIRSVQKMPPKYQGTPRPTIAVAGRSNVGKSTLINTLLGQKVAATSKTPGRTRAVYRFLLNERFDLVDLPGYGFAKVGLKMRLSWRKKVSDFLSGHGNLRCLLVLIDIRRGTGELDIELLDWAQSENVLTAIVLTKSDKLSKQKRLLTIRKIKEEFKDAIQVFPVSATKRQGLYELGTAMQSWWEDDTFSTGKR